MNEGALLLAKLLKRIDGSPVGSEIGEYYYGSLFSSSTDAITAMQRDGYIEEANEGRPPVLQYALTPSGYSVFDGLDGAALARVGIRPLWFAINRARRELNGWPDGDRLAALHCFVCHALEKYAGEPYEKAYAYRVLGEIDALRGDFGAAVVELRKSLSINPAGGVKKMIVALEEEIRNASV